MLSLFPSLLDFGLFAPTLLRLVAGFIFIDLGYLVLTSEKSSWDWLCNAIGLKPSVLWRKILGYIEIIGGALLVLGLYTQGAALGLAILVFIELIIEYKEPTFLKRDLAFYAMLLVITLSLLLTGPGLIAFDLPL